MVAELKKEIQLVISSSEMEKRRYLKKVAKLRDELDIEVLTSNDEKRGTLSCIQGTEQQKRNLSTKLSKLYEKNRRLSIT